MGGVVREIPTWSRSPPDGSTKALRFGQQLDREHAERRTAAQPGTVECRADVGPGHGPALVSTAKRKSPLVASESPHLALVVSVRS